MKKFIGFMLVTVFMGASFAQGIPQFGIPMKDTDAIEKQIEAALKKETGFAALKDFHVNWISMPCLQIEPSEMNPDLKVGVCSVQASAFQVSAKAVIVRKSSGYDVSIVFADVE